MSLFTDTYNMSSGYYDYVKESKQIVDALKDKVDKLTLEIISKYGLTDQETISILEFMKDSASIAITKVKKHLV
jgi:hypothetical protein